MVKSIISIRQMSTRRTDAIDAYFHDLRSIPRISTEEETALIKAYKAGDEKAGEKVICANLRFVVSAAKQYSAWNVPLADLISVGNIGLMTALVKFDHTLGFKFLSYAVHWVRREMLTEITKHGRMIRLPMSVYIANREFRKKYGEDMPELDLLKVDSLDRNVGDDGPVMHEKIQADVKMPDDFAISPHAVNYFIDRLTSREQTVVRMRCGIGYPECYTFLEIGKMLPNESVTHQRAHQIYNKAMKKMKNMASKINMEEFNKLERQA